MGTSDFYGNGSSSSSNSSLPRHVPPKNSGGIKGALSKPAQWVNMYDDFITKNAHQVSQIESTLRSLTYIIPGAWTLALLTATHSRR